MAKIVTITNPLTGQPAQVDQLDHTAQQIDDCLNIARWVSNPNLLDNWYFGNPVDQRGGYVITPNTRIYSDAGLTNLLATAGPNEYVQIQTVTEITDTYAKFVDSGGSVRYTEAVQAPVRGYTGAGYGFDRCKLLTSQCAVTIDNDGITLHRNGGDQWIYAQPLEPELVTALTGKSVVISTLTDAGLVEFPVSSAFTAEQSVVSTSGTCIWLSTAGHLYLGTTADSVKLKAAKLELGSQQTLAHQDSSGKWVLNEIPDYGEQLARCQRYHFEFGPSHSLIAYDGYGVNSPVVYFPVQMRTVSAIKVYSKAGTENAITYWTGSAEVDFTDFSLEWNENFVVLRSNGKFTQGGIYAVGKLIAYADL